MIVTIDGPAGAGKSSVAQTLARRVGFQFLDTGAMYRAITLAAKRVGLDWADRNALVALAAQQTISFRDDRTLLGDEDVSTEIRANEISQLVCHAANNPGVRELLVARQRELGAGMNLVTEGRDQGTVVFPDAELKIYLTASPEERARRRWLDLQRRGETVDLAELLAQQIARDASDSARDVGPLKPADDALELITDGLTREQVELRLEQMVHRRQRELVERSALPSHLRAAATTDRGELREFVWRLPKAELHVHLEGTLEPELLLTLAERNRVAVPFRDVTELRAAYQFTDLQSFLNQYAAGQQVLHKERDFFDLAWAYFERAAAQGVRHVELFFDPQDHATRGVPFASLFYGIMGAVDRARQSWGITTLLIPCVQRHLPVASALQMLAALRPYRSRLAGVGLDSSERGHPPSDFREVFAEVRKLGLRVVAHAGEEGPADYIRQALDDLQACRIDHGVRCVEDPVIVERLRSERVPLTICPLSNRSLQVCRSWQEQPLRRLLEAGLLVTVNSDDPAYFGGYIAENYWACHEHLGLDRQQLIQLARHSFEAAWLSDERRRQLLAEIDQYARCFGERR